MPAIWIIAVVLVTAITGYFLARQRALASAESDPRKLHSLPTYYGLNAAILAAGPALLILAVWLIAQPLLINGFLIQHLPVDAAGDAGTRSLAMADVNRIAGGLDQAVTRGLLTAAQAQNLQTDTSNVRELLAAAGVALGADIDHRNIGFDVWFI